MYICICSNLNETELRSLIKSKKINSIKEFRKLNCCDGCGKCYAEIQKILRGDNGKDLHERDTLGFSTAIDLFTGYRLFAPPTNTR